MPAHRHAIILLAACVALCVPALHAQPPLIEIVPAGCTSCNSGLLPAITGRTLESAIDPNCGECEGCGSTQRSKAHGREFDAVAPESCAGSFPGLATRVVSGMRPRSPRLLARPRDRHCPIAF